MTRLFLGAILALATTGVAPAAQKTAPAPAAPPAPVPATKGVPYEKFIDGATAQRGLFTIWRKDGQVALELTPQQLGKDYVELGVPVNGIGQGLLGIDRFAELPHPAFRTP